MILLIDNYDSFVHNIARYLRELGWVCQVVRNNEIELNDIAALSPSHIVISPGPRGPRAAGISNAVVERFGPLIPLLGVCLGHQCIGEVYGGKVVRARRPLHGTTSLVSHDDSGIFRGLKNPLRVTHYHSLIVDDKELPSELKVTARGHDGEIMAMQHVGHPVAGVQFHPEAVLTEEGHRLLQNFFGEPARSSSVRTMAFDG